MFLMNKHLAYKMKIKYFVELHQPNQTFLFHHQNDFRSRSKRQTKTTSHLLQDCFYTHTRGHKSRKERKVHRICLFVPYKIFFVSFCDLGSPFDSIGKVFFLDAKLLAHFSLNESRSRDIRVRRKNDRDSPLSRSQDTLIQMENYLSQKSSVYMS